MSGNAVEGLDVKQRTADGNKGGVLMVLYLVTLIISVGIIMLIAMKEVGELISRRWRCIRFRVTDSQYDGFSVVTDPHVFYTDIEPTHAAKAATDLRSIAVHTLSYVSARTPWRDGVDVGYILPEEDKAQPLEGQQKAVASELPADSFNASLQSGQSPFLNVPDRLADVIEKAFQLTCYIDSRDK
ncbi:hypothetical protein F5Y16DRAFT_400347 [Xylariaceae sp. FL0255]|nr:hypothetical protein F5Y16DRAFT_400347 [Xylariaceae sp. FL0255]